MQTILSRGPFGKIRTAELGKSAAFSSLLPRQTEYPNPPTTFSRRPAPPQFSFGVSGGGAVGGRHGGRRETRHALRYGDAWSTVGPDRSWCPPRVRRNSATWLLPGCLSRFGSSSVNLFTFHFIFPVTHSITDSLHECAEGAINYRQILLA